MIAYSYGRKRMSDITPSHVRNLKRDRLLTEKETERLVNREDKTKQPVYDARVRKKLSNWLKTLDEVFLIFNSLPEEQTSSVVTNENAFELLCLAVRALKIKDYFPVDGLVNDPYSWKVEYDRCKPLDYKKSNSKLYRAKYGEFIIPPGVSGSRKFDTQLLSFLQLGATMTLERLLHGLDIDPSDSEAVEIVQMQLEALSKYGIVENTNNGWRWVVPRESKQKKS